MREPSGSRSDNEGRRQRIAEMLGDSRLGAFITTTLPNVRYLTGFIGSNGVAIVTRDDAVLFTDPRYATQAPQEADCTVRVVKHPVAKAAANWLARRRIHSVGIEQNRIGLAEWELLRASAPKTRWKPTAEWVETLRSVKSEDEIALIRQSVQVNSKALEQALRKLQPGKTTELDLAAEIDYRMRRLGASAAAFPTIVASGVRTALPHAHPELNLIRQDELLLVDVGAIVAGYCSDMTRTYATGELSGRQRQMYKAVLQSQLAAMDTIRPGVAAAAVDKTARLALREYGWDKLFIHSTGHGLGLEIHERPRVGRKEKTKLEVGMIVTVEPGVYEEGVGGVRIEDTVLVTTRGCEPLTPTSKEWTVL